ncbi:MAG: phosphatase PAP2 family protein [Bacteroidales bacterium]|nr:phosphatase PAP2 family protein [Bacteroidales bacterium]
MKTYHKLQLFTAIVLSVALLSCTQQTAKDQQPVTSLSKEIKEIHQGILEGYLSKDEIPNSLKLVPPPPQKGSVAFQLDQEIAAKYVAMDDEDRKDQAAKDAVLSFPEATEAFNMVLDIKISEETTPHLIMILRRTLADAGLSTYTAKNHYQRKRPFMVNNTAICTPEEEAMLRKDGSYPSGHTAIGWAWALILAEVFPDNADVILERGKQFGISRNVCNVHWHSDVVYGRMMGAATVAMLHSNTDFMIDLKAAKEEIKTLKSLINN